MTVQMVRTWAQTIRVHRDTASAYDDLHARVWPEVLNALRDVGVIDMRIFRSGERLFMFMTTVDGFNPDVDFARHLKMSPKCEEWSALTRTFQKPSEDAKDGEWWTYMDEVFNLQAQLTAIDESGE